MRWGQRPLDDLTYTNRSGSFTGTLTGCTTSPTTTIQWRQSGGLISLTMSANLFATSNTTACTVTGLPADLAPAALQRMAVRMQDNTVVLMGVLSIAAASTTLTLIRGDDAAFTAAGTKGLGAFTAVYQLK